MVRVSSGVIVSGEGCVDKSDVRYWWFCCKRLLLMTVIVFVTVFRLFFLKVEVV